MSFGVASPAHRKRRDKRKESHEKSPEVHLSSAVARVILVLLVVVTPWTLGGVFASIQVTLFTGVVVALFCWLSTAVAGRHARVTFPLLFLPLAGGLLLGLAQLRPIPAGIYRVLSPAGAEVRSAFARSEAFEDATTLVSAASISGTDARFPISLAPASTRRDLSLLVLATAVFLLGVRYFRTTRELLILCWIVTINGALIAFFGIVQRLTWNGHLFWSIPITSGGSPFGPFVNRNNGGGYLTLCLAAAIAVLAWSLAKAGSKRKRAKWDLLQESAGKPFTWRDRVVGFFATLNAPQVALFVLMGCIVAGILCSLSRGAFLAMVGGALITVVAASIVQRRLTSVWILAVAGMFAMVVVMWVGMSRTVGIRLSSLLDQDRPEARLPHWRDTFRSVGDYWLLGSGYGTYSSVYGAYQQHDDRTLHTHAENQLLEALVTGGIPGAGLVVIAILLAAVASIRLLGFKDSKHSHGFALLGLFALSSQVIHGMVDFGLYLPANMLLFALLMGAVAGRAASLGAERRARGGVALPAFKKIPVTAFVLIALFLGVFLGRSETSRAAAVEAVKTLSKRVKEPSKMSLAQVQADTDRLEAAARNRPDDGAAHLQLAELYLQLFRLRAVEIIRREQQEKVGLEEIWPFTSTAQLHFQAHRLKENSTELEAFRSRMRADENLQRARDHLLQARAASPLLARTYIRLAELSSVLDMDPEVDSVHLACAERLAPGDADLLFHLGVLHLNANRGPQALSSWEKCLKLTGAFDEQILRMVRNSPLLSSEAVLAEMPASPERLIRLAKSLELPVDSPDRERLLAQALAALPEAEMPEAQKLFLQGQLHSMRNAPEAAVESYEKAVALKRRNVEWHYELAQTLKQLGRLDEAQEHAGFCVSLNRADRKYHKLLAEIVDLKLKR